MPRLQKTPSSRLSTRTTQAPAQPATGKYLAFLDADDLYEPEMLADMYSQAEQAQADVVMCRCDHFSTEPAYLQAGA